MNFENKSRLTWPLIVLSGTALISTAAGVIAQTETKTSNLPEPPKITRDVPPAPEGGPDGPPPPPVGAEFGGPDGPGPRGPEGMGPEGRGPEARGPREGRGPGAMRGFAGRRGPEDGPGFGPGPDGRGPRGRGPEGPGPDGLGPKGGPRGESRPLPPDANTSEGAAKSLERAYRAAGEVGDVNGESRDVSTQARSLYNQAMAAYNAKDYDKAFQLAEGSARLSRTAHALTDVQGNALPKVDGLTPPPVVKKADDDDADRSAHELNRAYRETNDAAQFENSFSKQWHGRAETNYRAALTAYNAKRYEEAARRARLGAEQAKAAREYGETLKS